MRTLSIMLVTLGIAGCATVYTAPHLRSEQSRYMTVAILPFAMNMPMSQAPKGFTQADLRTQREKEAYTLRRILYLQLLVHQALEGYTVKFQDIDETNVLLRKGGITYGNLQSHSIQQLASLLGVDAVVSGSVSETHPMKNAAAIVSGIFLYGYSATNKLSVKATIRDGSDGALLWSYEHALRGALGSSADEVAIALTKSLSNRLPFKKPQ